MTTIQTEKDVAPTDSSFELLKREVDSIQIHLLASTKPWYRQASTIISLLAFLFSFGTTAISLIRARDQDRHSWKQEIRGLIMQIVDLPLKNAELLEKNAANPLALGSVNATMNQETIILTDQAILAISKIPDLVTSNEYLAVAGALSSIGSLTKANELRVSAIELAES